MIDVNIFNNLAPEPYEVAQTKFQIGDLLLCSGTSVISQLIKETTNSIFSHVGLILQLPTTLQWLVLESVESIGVRCVTLEEGYITNYMGNGRGYNGKILIARHQAMRDKFHHIAALYQIAFSLLGDQYNEQDIFHIGTRYALGKVGIDEEGKLKGGSSYICSEYVYACYKAIGINLLFNHLGFIAPADIANAIDVQPVVHIAV